MFRYAPKWLLWFLIVTAVYAFANFFYVLAINHDGHMGTTALDVRLFTGHWMMFHAMATAGLYPADDANTGSVN